MPGNALHPFATSLTDKPSSSRIHSRLNAADAAALPMGSRDATMNRVKRIRSMPEEIRYEEDFYAWTQDQARLLRSVGGLSDNRLDREHLAEEVEDLGKSERDAVRSQVRRILEHFLKLRFSPAQAPRYDWMARIAEARSVLSDKLSLTLLRDAEATLPKLYADARRQAFLALAKFGEENATNKLPTQCPFSLDEVRRDEWYPEPP
jgi:hypothetical protein